MILFHKNPTAIFPRSLECSFSVWLYSAPRMRLLVLLIISGPPGDWSEVKTSPYLSLWLDLVMEQVPQKGWAVVRSPGPPG